MANIAKAFAALMVVGALATAAVVARPGDSAIPAPGPRPGSGIDGAIRPACELQRGVILLLCGYGC